MTNVFTVESANRTLPLVRRIVEDLVRHYALLQERRAELLASRRPPVGQARAVIEKEMARLDAEIDGFVEELASLGVEAKPPWDSGLVDFPGAMEGRLVYLCWQLGEPAVQHWHEIDAGFAGRQPLTPLPASADSP
jgi:hypothetical protein